MNYFDTLDDWTILQIVSCFASDDQMSRYLAKEFRLTCRRMYSIIGRCTKKINADYMMKIWARNGNLADIISPLRSCGAYNFEIMLQNAARGGWRKICELARKWGARDFNKMLGNAARCEKHNALELCSLAREWGARDFRWMFFGAARRKDSRAREFCELAKKWSAQYESEVYGDNSVDWMLRGAARGGSRELCELARSWGARNFDGMMWHAARSIADNNIDIVREICELAREWGADDFDGMMCIAARCGGKGARELCHIAYRWGARDFDRMLRDAVCGDDAREMCALAREWGARDFNGMLIMAAQHGGSNAREICALAREWGANDFDELLQTATIYDSRIIYDLALQWGGRNFGNTLPISDDVPIAIYLDPNDDVESTMFTDTLDISFVTGHMPDTQI
jgi:hypothetical protein